MREIYDSQCTINYHTDETFLRVRCSLGISPRFTCFLAHVYKILHAPAWLHRRCVFRYRMFISRDALYLFDWRFIYVYCSCWTTINNIFTMRVTIRTRHSNFNRLTHTWMRVTTGSKNGLISINDTKRKCWICFTNFFAAIR